jgi:hypothetical protein
MDNYMKFIIIYMNNQNKELNETEQSGEQTEITGNLFM